ncbi:uncharacterized protein LOC113324300 [Papaver somniferum]|uniref:uncharacterized protein LOC113324300 n=1 Tax=Papaver somniferum TaxID=3469 RepID=UPI000E700EC5|nr:uncharacterized protein LOC113324300 [Papaver somniferum]
MCHDSLSTPHVISSTRQAITVQVGDVMVTGIHAECLTIDRRSLWDELVQINTWNAPWLVIGDFNVVLSNDEKKGGRNPLRISMQEFRGCLESCNLIQATRTGIKYSWCNNRVGRRRILCDLEKAFFNIKWLEKYEGWCYKVGVRGTSDHGALIRGVYFIPKPINTPFRYQISMDNSSRIPKSDKRLMGRIFGDLKIKLKSTEDEVLVAALDSDAAPENIELLDKLIIARGKHELVAQQYNEMMRNKSRIKWVKEGGANTTFFHTIMRIRRAWNNIVEIENDEVNLITDKKQIADVLVNHYQKKFEERIFEMNANSAPGHDGFPGCFYKFAWEVIGTKLVEAIQFCCRNNYIPKGFNSNFLFLLPKIQGAKRDEHFRPIGLANFNFKIITRIITTRIGTMIDKMVSIQQSAFIKGRNIQEKIVLAYELMNEMDIKRI